MSKNQGVVFGLTGIGVWIGSVVGLLVGHDHIPDPIGAAFLVVIMSALYGSWYLYVERT